MHLTGIELLDWIALRRVHEGGVTVLDFGYVRWGRKVPCYLPEIFDRLSDAELISSLDVDFSTESRRVVLMPRGLDRYQELTAKRGTSVDPEQSSGDRPYGEHRCWPETRYRPSPAKTLAIVCRSLPLFFSLSCPQCAPAEINTAVLRLLVRHQTVPQ